MTEETWVDGLGRPTSPPEGPAALKAPAARWNVPDQGACEICGDAADDEMGEFWDTSKQNNVWAHAGCGADAGLDLA